MDHVGISIASVLLQAVILALASLKEFLTRAGRKHTCNTASIHRHPIQRTTRLKYPIDNFMEPDLPRHLLSFARPNVAHCRDHQVFDLREIDFDIAGQITGKTITEKDDDI
jgi:hypothetical protein